MMKIAIQCSNCGHRSREYRIDRASFYRIGERYTEAGWDSFGDAFYCRDCVRTWEARNGKGRRLWGPSHTRGQVMKMIVGGLLDEIERLKGTWEP